VGTLGWLTWRVYHRGSAGLTTGAAPILPPDAYFFTVRAAGNQVGIGSITIDTLSDGVQITERIGLDLPIHPTSSRSQYTSQYTIGTDLRLREFRITVPGQTTPVVQQGTVEGDSIIRVSPGNGKPTWRLDVRNRSLIPPLAAPVALALQQRLKTGEHLDVPVIDLLTLNEGTIALTVLDDSTFLVPDSADFDSLSGVWIPAHSDTLRAWKLNWSNGNETVQMWVDSRGLPIRLISATGLSLDRSAFEIVTINYRHRRGSQTVMRTGGVVPRTTIAAGVEPESGVASMRVRLSTERDPGEVTLVTRTSLDSLNGALVPDSALAPWLSDAPLLSLGDTTVQNQARTILEDEQDPREKANRLLAWVSQHIKRTPDLLVPRAAMVLRERQADVDGHTLLFVALARASGLPARPVSGILLAGEKFYLHSWAEVYLGGWVPVDPTWGEIPATANRVRLATGTLARPMDLLPLVAGLDAELISLNQRP
jgi:hypothetical protein